MPQNTSKDSQVRAAGGERSNIMQAAGSFMESQATQAGQAGLTVNRVGASFAARFGRLILAHGIAALPSALYHYQGKLKLSAQQVWFVSYILSHKWDADLPYPSLKKMGRSTGISERHLRRMKSTLCQKGLLEVYPRYGERERRDTDAYDFSGLFGRLERILAAEPPAPNAIRAEGPNLDAVETGETDSSFVARYGRVISRHGVTAVPRAIFTHQSALSLTPQQVWFITYIFSFQWDTSLPYPSIRRMATVTGYSSVQLHNIKAELVKAGHLRLVRRKDEQGGQDSNAYDFSGLLDAVRTLLQRDAATDTTPEDISATSTEEDDEEEPRRRGRKAKPKVEKAYGAYREDRGFAGRTDVEFAPPGDTKFTGVGDTELPGRVDRQFTGRKDRRLSGVGDTDYSGASKQASLGRVTPTLQGGRTRGLHEIEAPHIKENKEDDSNRLSKKSVSVTKDSTQPKANAESYSPYIAGVASDFSRELGDAAHDVSNIKQALNLWQASGLSEQAFVELMQEARKRTRKYQSRPTWDAMNNKMAYYFAALRDLLGQSAGG